MKRRFVRLTIFVLLMIPVFTITSQPKHDPAERYSVEVAEVWASSFVTSEKGNVFRYHPVMAFDGDPKTAWNEGVEGEGKYESVRIDFFDEIWVDGVAIMPGFYDKRWYASNNRIKKLVFGYRTKSKGDFLETNYDLTDGMEIKRFTFPAVKIISAEFVIGEVFPGNRYDDTCISGIVFYYRKKRIALRGMNDFKQLLVKNPAFSTPSGFLMTEGSMYPTYYYFFTDFICISIRSADETGSIMKGTWRLEAKNREITVDFTEREVFQGLGKSIDQPSYIVVNTYFENYRYFIKKIKMSWNIGWSIFQERPLAPTDSYFRLLTKRDYTLRILPQPDAAKRIEKLRKSYRETLRRQQEKNEN
ncbi:MAG: hypothetical protein JXD23_01470 [Spirochaetales bacterium]|nr:hypothetical protein [Spirochaetales bacterium]